MATTGRKRPRRSCTQKWDEVVHRVEYEEFSNLPAMVAEEMPGAADARPWDNKIVTVLKKMAESETFKTTKDMFPFRVLPIMGKKPLSFEEMYAPLDSYPEHSTKPNHSDRLRILFANQEHLKKMEENLNNRNVSSPSDWHIASVEVGSVRGFMRNCGADIVVNDLGPNSGALNQTIQANSDYLIPQHMPDMFSMQAWRDSLTQDIPRLLKLQENTYKGFNKSLNEQIQDDGCTTEEGRLCLEDLKLKTEPPRILPNLVHNIKMSSSEEEEPQDNKHISQTKRAKRNRSLASAAAAAAPTPIACQKNFCKGQAETAQEAEDEIAKLFVPLKTVYLDEHGEEKKGSARSMIIPLDRHSEPALSMAQESGRALVDLDEETIDYYCDEFEEAYSGKKEAIMASVKDSQVKYKALAKVIIALLEKHQKVPSNRGLAMIVTVISGKGGVGKSCAACSLASCLADLGKKTALLDMDSTASASAIYTDLDMLDKIDSDLLVGLSSPVVVIDDDDEDDES